MPNLNCNTPLSSAPASESSTPGVLITSESSPRSYAGSAYYSPALDNAESAGPASCNLSPPNSAPKRRGLYKKPSKRCRFFKRASNQCCIRRKAKKNKRSNPGSSPASQHSSDGSVNDASESDSSQHDGLHVDSHELENLQDAEPNIRVIDVSNFHIPRLDVNGRVIPEDPELDSPKRAGPHIDTADLNPFEDPERRAPVPAERRQRDNSPLIAHGHRHADPPSPEANVLGRDSAARDNRAVPQREPARVEWLVQRVIQFCRFVVNDLPMLPEEWLIQKVIQFRRFVAHDLPRWPEEWQVVVRIAVPAAFMLLAELFILTAVMLAVGWANTFLRMQSGPRRVSRQILEDIPWTYLRNIRFFFSMSLLMDGYIIWRREPARRFRLRHLPVLYLAMRSLDFWGLIIDTLLVMYAVLSVTNCLLLVPQLLPLA